MRMALMVHLLQRHVRETAVILEEGNPPQPLSPRFDILVPWVASNSLHTTIAQCARGAKQKRRRLVAEEIRESRFRDFLPYGRPL